MDTYWGKGRKGGAKMNTRGSADIGFIGGRTVDTIGHVDHGKTTLIAPTTTGGRKTRRNTRGGQALGVGYRGLKLEAQRGVTPKGGRKTRRKTRGGQTKIGYMLYPK